ncbi:MAG: hypothetical protein MI784_16320 [Cytophagales bacterium]|nr:hypothetical protein [Cytophagales bacterium]
MTRTRNNLYMFDKGFGASMLAFMGIYGVPRYMIFDKEGRLVDYNADRPDRRVEQKNSPLENRLRKLAEEPEAAVASK